MKKTLSDCFRGANQNPQWAPLQETIKDFLLTSEPLERIITGVEGDLKPVRFKKFSDLHRYALRVAGGPGLASMEIFGFKDQPHRDYAENLGVFLQIVNMVRDFKEDRALGRQYFPLEDFRKFHLNPADIGDRDSAWKSFIEFQLARAWSFLEKARRSLSLRQRAVLPTAESIAAVYVKLHQRLLGQPDLILEGKISLSPADKLLSVLGAAGRCLIWKWMEK